MKIPCKYCDEELENIQAYIDHLDGEHAEFFRADVKQVTDILVHHLDGRLPEKADALTTWDTLQDLIWQILREADDDGKG